MIATPSRVTLALNIALRNTQHCTSKRRVYRTIPPIVFPLVCLNSIRIYCIVDNKLRCSVKCRAFDFLTLLGSCKTPNPIPENALRPMISMLLGRTTSLRRVILFETICEGLFLVSCFLAFRSDLSSDIWRFSAASSLDFGYTFCCHQ